MSMVCVFGYVSHICPSDLECFKCFGLKTVPWQDALNIKLREDRSAARSHELQLTGSWRVSKGSRRERECESGCVVEVRH